MELEIERSKCLAEIESERFRQIVGAIGADTIRAIAVAPQEHKVKMLRALGMKSTLLTDARSPVNLFQTANGLIGTGGVPSAGIEDHAHESNGNSKDTDDDINLFD